MAENKTKATDASVDEYIASRGNTQQQADCRELTKLMKRVTGKPPKMWGPSIVGFDSYRYTYESGHSGEAPLAAFAIRGKDIVTYLTCEEAARDRLLERLGKHRMGKGCLYFRKLSDLDMSVLEELVVESAKYVKRRYGA
ncbi:MAG TPA: DUF1801 domain-containing protein [Gemmatimonadales bacterium]|nr:DUF1801 domain-containing protein [Gemmatimonadales bacterium]